MRKALSYACCVLLFVQTVSASSGVSFHPAAPFKYAKAPLRFSTYGKYLQYNRKRLFEGLDSANAFYKRETEKAEYTYTDYLPLTAGSSFPLTGTLYGTDASFSGNIGIGTTSPSANAKLHIVGSNALIYTQPGADDGQLNGFDLLSSNGIVRGGLTLNSLTGEIKLNAVGSYFPTFYANGSEVMRISTAGNIGIGTTSPSANAKLHIVGSNALIYTQPSADDGQLNGFDLLSSNGIVRGGLTLNSLTGEIKLNAVGSYFPTFYANGSEVMRISTTGNIGIGTTSPSDKLSINGNVYANGNISANGFVTTKKLTITQTGWSDYVFNKDYKLRTLQQVESFINQYKHLPEIPSAEEVAEKGISVGDNQALLLKKIEELTLYVIDQQKQIDELKKQIKKR